MKRLLVLVVTISTTGCGLESAGTAATVATLKAKEVQQAQETKAQIIQQVGDIQQQADQRLKEAEQK